MYCKICNKELNNFRSLCNHLPLHKISILDYYIKYENFEIPKCDYCDNYRKIRQGIDFHKTCCNKDCVSKHSSTLKHSDETKNKLSIIQKNWLKNNPDKHPWKNNGKFISKPCEKLKNDLIENDIIFSTEIKPLDNKNYSIDIAFIDKGIGIEVNGNQHYNPDKTLKTYYQNRKEEIEKNGWILYDIHYTKVFNKEFIKDLIKKIKGENINLDLDFTIINKIQNYCICGKEIGKLSKRCNDCEKLNKRKVERPDKDILLKEITENGYTSTGRKYGVSDTSIRKWLK